MNKLALGTVQFGLKYGINNKIGLIDDSNLKKILTFAQNNNINTLDIAYNYGESEKRLGNLLIDVNKFNIISKAPKGTQSSNIFDYFHETISRLNTNSLYGYLLHDFNDYESDNKISSRLNDLKDKLLVKKIGFSLYYPEQLEKIFSDKIKFDLIQIPYNLADKRFEKYFEELKRRGIEIHVRSVFLQGLFFMQKNELPNKLKIFSEFIQNINEIRIKIKKSIENISLNFVLQNNFIDKAVIGIDSIEQLQSNIVQTVNKLSKEELGLIKNSLKRIKIPEELLIPSNWK